MLQLLSWYIPTNYPSPIFFLTIIFNWFNSATSARRPKVWFVVKYLLSFIDLHENVIHQYNDVLFFFYVNNITRNFILLPVILFLRRQFSYCKILSRANPTHTFSCQCCIFIFETFVCDALFTFNMLYSSRLSFNEGLLLAGFVS